MTTIWEYGSGVAGGAPWIPGGIASSVNPNSTLKSQVFTSTAGQQLFTLTSFAYALGSGALIITVNGVTQINGVDYTETTTTSVTFTSGLNLGDVVHVMGFVGVTSTFVGVPVSSSVWCGTAVASGVNFTLTPTSAITSYVDGQRYLFYSGAYTNSVANITCSISGLASLNVVIAPPGGLPFVNQLIAGSYYELIYNGTFGVFILSEVQSLTSRASTLLLGSSGTNYLADASTDGVKLVSTSSDIRLTAINGSYATSNATYVGGFWTRFNIAAVTYKTEVTAAGFKLSYAGAAAGNIVWTDLITATNALVTIVPTLTIGDYGTESAGIVIAGTTYQPTLRINDISSASPAQLILHRHSTTQVPLILGARANTDTSAHADVTLGQKLLSLQGVGYAGTDYKVFSEISFRVNTSGTVSDTSAPGRLVFSTVTSGTLTLTDRLVVDTQGNFGFSVSPYYNNSANFRSVDFGAYFQLLYKTTSPEGYLVSGAHYDGAAASLVYNNSTDSVVYSTYAAGTYLIYTAPAGTINTAVTPSLRFKLDSDGNIGISSTLKTNTSASIKNFEYGPYSGMVVDTASTATDWLSNAYYGTAGYKYSSAAVAVRVGLASGAATIYTAIAGATPGDSVTWTQRFNISNSGQATVSADRLSGTNANSLTLSDSVTGAQTANWGNRLVSSSNSGSLLSAIGFEVGGDGTNNQSQLCFYTQASSGGGLQRRLLIDYNGIINTYSNTGMSATSGVITTTETLLKSRLVGVNLNAIGQAYRIKIYGICTSSAANASTFRVRLGTAGTLADTAVYTFSPTAATSGTNVNFTVEANITTRTTGSSGALYANWELINQGTTGIYTNWILDSLGVASAPQNLTLNNYITISVQTAAATTSLTIYECVIEQML